MEWPKVVYYLRLHCFIRSFMSMFLDILHQRLLLDDDPVWDPDTLQILEAVVFDEDVDCQDSESNLESGINHMSHHTRRHWTCIMLTKRI